MEIRQYLDSTYLKTAQQAGLSESANTEVVTQCVAEAIAEGFKLAMIRPEHVAMARKMVDAAKSSVLVGTVIDFPKGQSSIQDKLSEAARAIADGADELDFVCNYNAFKDGDTDLLKEEIFACTKFGLDHMKTVKWIIEVAALNDMEIARISALIKAVVVTHFEGHYNQVFVKSSTGFYATEAGKPNGATIPSVTIMLENAAPLPVKAAGGVRTFDEAVEMVNLGVTRIGTSAAKTIAEGGTSQNAY
ncbi:Deoxyribose-phosphate aldolase [Flavobacterium longum]|uniref:deoxyribose-phosphate aldolase n=1 Tax=Flavobacterium longum TaxID=1299340 RepID=UPI0039EB44CE